MTGDRAFVITSACPECERGTLRIRRRKIDKAAFIGCSRFPRCKFVENYDDFVQPLLREVEQLRVLLGAPTRAVDLAGAMKRVQELIFDCHPDRNPGGLDANGVTAKLIELRALIERAA